MPRTAATRLILATTSAVAHNPPSAPLAYSYVRFSSTAQLEGDSLRRQTERAAAYCQRAGLTLDTSLSLRDLGVSAFRGANAAVGNFRVFLDAVKNGTVPPGSVLVVESFDRISRQGIDEGYDLIKSILKAGVSIVTLSPERRFDQDATRSLSKGALEIQLILERAAEESETKAVRVGAAWRAKQRQAGTGHLLTRVVPAWIEVTSDRRMKLIPERAAIVRRIYRESIAGSGCNMIAHRLNADGLAPFTATAGSWGASAVRHILRARTTTGEYLPRTGGETYPRPAAGQPVPGYYPAVVNEQTWRAAAAAVGIRRTRPAGRPGRKINIFAGLLRDARDGSSIVLHTKGATGGMEKRLVSLAAWQGKAGSKFVTFPFDVFERAMLEHLAEVDAHSLFPDNDHGDEELAIRGELDRVRAQVERVKAKAEESPDLDDLADVLRRLREKEKGLAEKLAGIRQAATTDPRNGWAEFKSLAGLVATTDDPDEVRRRIRVALQRVVTSIWCVFTGLGPDCRERFAVAQVWFENGVRREYGIYYRGETKGACRIPEKMASVSFKVTKRAGEAAGVAADLRVRDNAARFLVDLDAVLAGKDVGRECSWLLRVVAKFAKRSR